MKVWIYVDTSKEVGDADHLKKTLPRYGFRKTTRKALRSRMRFWNEPLRRAAAYRLLAAFLILKSSIRLPDPNFATSQRGCLPRPAQVSEG